jgi:ethanolamine utilization cobalamin adenosyltransferase
MTHLHSNVLVSKTHPRIRFRGTMDSLEAELLLCQLNCERWGKELGEILNLARKVIRYDVLEEPAKQEKLCGLTEAELRSHSHRPQDYYGQTHFMPEVTDGAIVLHLNRCRAAARAAELAAAEAFTDENGNCIRPDILQALNRMSSMIYILMIREKAER